MEKEPGDRAESCRSLMEPRAVSIVGDSYRITQHCLACGYEKVNTSSPEDQFETLLDIVRRTNDQLAKG